MNSKLELRKHYFTRLNFELEMSGTSWKQGQGTGGGGPQELYKRQTVDRVTRNEL